MSKKLIYPICLALVLALAGFAQAELLVNGDFEAGTPLNDTWITWGGGSGSGAGGYFWSSAYGATVIEDGTAYSGNKYVEAGLADEGQEGWWWNGMWVWQEHSVTEGKTYQLSGWVRDGDADGAPSLIPGGVSTSFEWRDIAPIGGPTGERGNEISRDVQPFDLTEQWTYVSATAVAPAGAQGISIGFTAAVGINYDIDNASFIELGPPAFGDPIIIEVAAGTDDAEEDVGGGSDFAIDLTSSDLEIIYDNNPADPNDEQVMGLRFANVGIPKGSTIANAFVRFDADDVDDSEHVGNAYVLIDGQLDPNAATFEDTPNNITGRPRTAAQVQWTSEPWPADAGDHQKGWTADISSIIQEIVDQDAWVAGNALVLILSQDPATPSVGHRECESWDGDGGSVGRQPTLFIELGVAPAPDEIAREAESADVLGASWRLVVDPAASGGARIGSENGDGDDNNTAPGAEWVAIYNFDATGGTYKVVLRGLEAGSDSFWVRILGATSINHEHPDQPGTGWARFNEMSADGLTWDEVHSNNHNNDVVYWTLPAGSHTIEIAKREDGTYFDGFIITNDLTLEQGKLPDVINPLASAIAPSPADGAGNVLIGSTLSWLPAVSAATHDVSFGTTSPPPFISNQAAASFYPGLLQPATTYYWQVDEVQADGTTTAGDVWSFTTGLNNVVMDIMIATGDDDAEEDVGGSASFVIDLTSSDLEIMHDNNPADPLDEQVIGIRFVDVGIPKGSTITSAAVRFDADDVDDAEHVGNAYILIDGELNPDPVTFENTLNNITGRPRTTAQAPWTSEPWPSDGGTHQKALTADISTIIQEIVDQDGWAGGNALVLIFSQDPANPSEGHRECESFNGAGGNADQRPMLSISALVESATGPSPADGAEGVPITGTIISWWPGANAVSHDGYIGTSSPPPLLGNITQVTFDPGVLAPSTTYYWQVDAVEADGTIHTGAIWSFTTELGEASQPDPADNAVSVALDKILSWSPGITVATHDVYFGTTSPPPFIGYQTEPNFDPGPLEPGTTYYWQVDEIEADGTTVYTGDVLSFETLTPPPPEWTSLDIDTTGGSTSYDPATGTFTITADGGDIWDNGDRFHFCYQTPTLTRGDCTLIANVASFDVPPNGNLWQKAGLMIRDTLDAGSINAFIGITGGNGDGASFQWRTDTDGGCGSSRTLVVPPPPASIKLVRKGDTFTAYVLMDGEWQQEGDSATLVMGDEVYVGLAVTSHITGSMVTAVIDNVSITTPNPNIAAIPDPADGTTEVQKTLTLSWTPGATAASHDVYISADEQAVIDGTAPVTTVTEASFSPADLAKGATYYWRVDEVEADGTTKHTGDVWSFTVTTLGR